MPFKGDCDDFILLVFVFLISHRHIQDNPKTFEVFFKKIVVTREVDYMSARCPRRQKKGYSQEKGEQNLSHKKMCVSIENPRL